MLALSDATTPAERKTVNIVLCKLFALEEMALHVLHLETRGNVDGVALQFRIATLLPNLRQRTDIARRAFNAAVQRVEFLAIVAGRFGSQYVVSDKPQVAEDRLHAQCDTQRCKRKTVEQEISGEIEKA